MLADDGYLVLGGTVLGVSNDFVAWTEARGIVRPVTTVATRQSPSNLPPSSGRIARLPTGNNVAAPRGLGTTG
jgi:hypothetical protein